MTTGLIAPGSSNFQALFRSFAHSAFRLETLQSYGASGEDSSFEAFRAGEPYTRHHGKDVWLGHIAHATSIGATMCRVHVLTEPLTEYVQFEATWAYAPNVAAGEDIRVICLDEGEDWPNGVPQSDFWLFDDERLYAMHYAESGSFLGVEPVTDDDSVHQARSARDAAWQRSIPWAHWISQRPDLYQHVPS